MKRPSPEEIELLHGRICQALADPTRISVLYELADGPRHVSALVEVLGQPQGTVSRHLRVLHQRGLVVTHRIGTKIEYRLKDDRVVQALDLMRALLADQLEHETAKAARIRAAKKLTRGEGRQARSRKTPTTEVP
jgi:DNA-binding transcriptional ArsR family regulator